MITEAARRARSPDDSVEARAPYRRCSGFFFFLRGAISLTRSLDGRRRKEPEGWHLIKAASRRSGARGARALRGRRPRLTFPSALMARRFPASSLDQEPIECGGVRFVVGLDTQKPGEVKKGVPGSNLPKLAGWAGNYSLCEDIDAPSIAHATASRRLSLYLAYQPSAADRANMHA